MGDADNLPLSVRELIAGWGLTALYAGSCRQACDPSLLTRADAVIVCGPEPSATPRATARHELQLLADALASHRLTGVVLSSGTIGVVPGGDDALIAIPQEVSADELWGRIATIQQYRPLLSRMEDQVAGMQRLGKKLNEHFVEVDQELRLASRLQRDFLPKQLPTVGDVRFHALYRPATWVCGDVYDVQRLDEAEFFLTGDERLCAFCVYRSLCNRGVTAGDPAALEGDRDEDALTTIDLDFEQIAEIEY